MHIIKTNKHFYSANAHEVEIMEFILLQKIYISNESIQMNTLFINHESWKKCQKHELVPELIIVRNVSWAPNLHISVTPKQCYFSIT